MLFRSLPAAPAQEAQRIRQALAASGWRVRLQKRETPEGDGWMVAAKAGAANKLGYIAAHSAIVLVCLGGLLDGDLFIRAQTWLGGKSVYTGGGLVSQVGGLCSYSGTHPDKAKHSVTNYPAIIDNCSVTIDIDAKDATHVGGLVGTGLYYYGKETAFRITNCSVPGTIDGAVTSGTILGRTNADSSYDAATKANAKVLVDGKSSGAEVGTTGRMYESADTTRSEERRVGKECRSRWSPYH